MQPRKKLTVRDVSSYTIGELEALWRRDFEYLTTTCTAVALRPKDPKLFDVSKALFSDGHIEETEDALNWVEGELRIAQERFLLTEDERLSRTIRNLEKVSALRIRAKRANEIMQRRVNKEKMTDAHMSAKAAAERLVMRLFPGEMDRLYESVCHSHGIPKEPPWKAPGSDLGGDIEEYVETDVVRVLRGSRIEQLREMDWNNFVRLVERDCQEQNDRTAELRDLRVVVRWTWALDTLLERAGVKARANALDGTMRKVDYQKMPYNEAKATIAARRSFLAVWQRRQEARVAQMRARRTMVVLQEQFAKRWKEAAYEARKLLISRHSDVHEFLLEKLLAYIVEGEEDRLFDNFEKPRYRGTVMAHLQEQARVRFGLELPEGKAAAGA